MVPSGPLCQSRRLFVSLLCVALVGLPLLGLTALQAVESDAAKPAAEAEKAAADKQADAKTPADKADDTKILGRRVPHFILPDAAGAEHSLHEFREQQALVVVLLGTQCPIGNRYVPLLNELHDRYKDQSVQFLGIYASPSDTAAKVAKHTADFKIAFPTLLDTQQHVLRAIGGQRMAEVFVLDSRRVVRYHGRIDDQYGYDAQRPAPTRADLEEAIKQVLARQTVSVAETPVEGCKLTRVKSHAPAGEITWSKQVSRILQNKCQECHHEGAVGPMELITADDAANWSAMIKQVVLQRQMPPWHADPRYGKFSNDRSLSLEEIDTLSDWVDAGAPVGKAEDAPPPREFASDWTIGKPDVVFELPREVTVPAKGTQPYMYFETPTNFEEDMWIEAAEARPGNRAVVHHIVVLYRDPKGATRDIGHQWITGAAPGDLALQLPDRVARKIPKGATLIWQMHYTPTGKVEKDRSRLGLRFYKGKEPPLYNALTRSVENKRFEITPGASSHEVVSELTVPVDVRILSYMPHMHVRGKDFEYQAFYPDGRTETLLSVPRYDFNWQGTYRLAEPKLLPRGTKIKCTAHYDNSADNPANPDPAKTVRWGEQTWEEMMAGFVNYTFATPLVQPDAELPAEEPEAGEGEAREAEAEEPAAN